jgi:hypothetical protein
LASDIKEHRLRVFENRMLRRILDRREMEKRLVKTAKSGAS